MCRNGNNKVARLHSRARLAPQLPGLLLDRQPFCLSPPAPYLVAQPHVLTGRAQAHFPAYAHDTCQYA